MANSAKRKRREEMDPNSMKTEKQYGNFPGLPNNPQNNQLATGNRPSLSGATENPYRDAAFVGDPRFGHQMAPAEYSGMPQSFTFGTKLNAFSPYGGQPQPPTSGVSRIFEGMEMARLTGSRTSLNTAKLAQDGLNKPTPMGFIGADNSVAPGGSRPDGVANARSLPLRGVQSAGSEPGMNMRTGKRNEKSDKKTA